MIRRPTWIILGIFAALLAFAFYWNQRPPVADGEDTPASQEPPWDRSLADIESVKIEHLNAGKSVELIRDPDAGWVMTQPLEGPVSQGTVDQALGWLARPTPYGIIETPKNLLQYGLVEPRGRLSVTFMDGTTQILLVGDDAPTGSRAYVMVPGAEDVIIANLFNVNPILDLVDIEILPTPTPEGADPVATETPGP
jgi:hypothetical protein